MDTWEKVNRSTHTKFSAYCFTSSTFAVIGIP